MPITNGNSTSTVNSLLNAAKQKAAKTLGAKESGSKEILFKEQPVAGQAPQPPYIWIDYPKQGDVLRGPHYVIRLGVGGAEAVELSIDKGSWQPCRFTSGYWWFDWKATPGKHTLVARMRTADGRLYKTPPRNCESRF